jgi:hypothetical protein
MGDELIQKTVVVQQTWRTPNDSAHHIQCTDKSRFVVETDTFPRETISTGAAYIVEYLKSQQGLLDRGDEVTAASLKGPLTLESGAVSTTEGK